MIIGLGKSGIALAEYIHSHKGNVTAYDKKPSESALSQIDKNIPVKTGEFKEEWLEGIDELVHLGGIFPFKFHFV